MFEALANGSSSKDLMVDELALLVEDMRLGNEDALESLYDATVGKLHALWLPRSSVTRRTRKRWCAPRTRKPGRVLRVTTSVAATYSGGCS